MGAEAFDGIANRGLKGSKLRHKNLKQMHQTEREYKSEKELKNSIRKLVRCLPSKGDILQEPSKLLKKYPLIGN